MLNLNKILFLLCFTANANYDCTLVDDTLIIGENKNNSKIEYDSEKKTEIACPVQIQNANETSKKSKTITKIVDLIQEKNIHARRIISEAEHLAQTSVDGKIDEEIFKEALIFARSFPWQELNNRAHIIFVTEAELDQEIAQTANTENENKEMIVSRNLQDIGYKINAHNQELCFKAFNARYLQDDQINWDKLLACSNVLCRRFNYELTIKKIQYQFVLLNDIFFFDSKTNCYINSEDLEAYYEIILDLNNIEAKSKEQLILAIYLDMRYQVTPTKKQLQFFARPEQEIDKLNIDEKIKQIIKNRLSFIHPIKTEYNLILSGNSNIEEKNHPSILYQLQKAILANPEKIHPGCIASEAEFLPLSTESKIDKRTQKMKELIEFTRNLCWQKIYAQLGLELRLIEREEPIKKPVGLETLKNALFIATNQRRAKTQTIGRNTILLAFSLVSRFFSKNFKKDIIKCNDQKLTTDPAFLNCVFLLCRKYDMESAKTMTEEMRANQENKNQDKVTDAQPEVNLVIVQQRICFALATKFKHSV